MSKFPKPWQVIPVDPQSFCVLDANNRKLFYIQEDDNPDGEGKPGDDDGPTILGYDEDDDELISEIARIFEHE